MRLPRAPSDAPRPARGGLCPANGRLRDGGPGSRPCVVTTSAGTGWLKGRCWPAPTRHRQTSVPPTVRQPGQAYPNRDRRAGVLLPWEVAIRPEGGEVRDRHGSGITETQTVRSFHASVHLPSCGEANQSWDCPPSSQMSGWSIVPIRLAGAPSAGCRPVRAPRGGSVGPMRVAAAPPVGCGPNTTIATAGVGPTREGRTGELVVFQCEFSQVRKLAPTLGERTGEPIVVQTQRPEVPKLSQCVRQASRQHIQGGASPRARQGQGTRRTGTRG